MKKIRISIMINSRIDVAKESMLKGFKRAYDSLKDYKHKSFPKKEAV